MHDYQRREGLMVMLIKHAFFWELEPNQLAAAIRTYNKLQDKNVQE